ncbi:MAG: DUF1569 domain-containing protein [Phycisphaerales bacterium]|nr:DUF1569 domain-containing protein [Phycisphaerales bacterium]
MSTLSASPSQSDTNAVDAPRRELRFETMQDILADAESIAAGPATTLGNWTAAQNIEHVRLLVHMSRVGADFMMPWPVRVLGRLLKTRFLRSSFKPGLKTADVFQPPAEITMDEAIAAFRTEIGLASEAGAMSEPSPFLGKMTHEEWVQLHCRHAEHHFGYVVGASSP